MNAKQQRKSPIAWLALLGLVALGALGYTVLSIREPAVVAPAASTAVAREGDIRMVVAGSGELVADLLPLSFAANGVLAEVRVHEGDVVQAGQVLARLDDGQEKIDLAAAQLDWQELVNQDDLLAARQALLQAQQALAEAEDALRFVQDGPPVWYYEQELELARQDYDLLKEEYRRAVRLSALQPRKYKPVIRQLSIQLERAEVKVAEAEEDLAWVQAYQPDPRELRKAEAEAALAAAQVDALVEQISFLEAGAVDGAAQEVLSAEALALARADLALRKAELALQQGILLAPQNGVITQVSARPGERVDARPVMTLMVDGSLGLRLRVEQADYAQLSIGDSMEVMLQAYPGMTFSGQITRIDPSLVEQDGEAYVQIWGSLDPQDGLVLLPGMALEAELVTAEAHDAVLVPQQAVRQAPDGSYYVDVLQPDGSFLSSEVALGVQDLANVQIISGLAAGAVVSTQPE